MILGKITNHEATISLEVSDSNGVLRLIKAVIDTGYNEYLTFPGDLVDTLRLTIALASNPRLRYQAHTPK